MVDAMEEVKKGKGLSILRSIRCPGEPWVIGLKRDMTQKEPLSLTVLRTEE